MSLVQNALPAAEGPAHKAVALQERQPVLIMMFSYFHMKIRRSHVPRLHWSSSTLHHVRGACAADGKAALRGSLLYSVLTLDTATHSALLSTLAATKL